MYTWAYHRVCSAISYCRISPLAKHFHQKSIKTRPCQSAMHGRKSAQESFRKRTPGAALKAYATWKKKHKKLVILLWLALSLWANGISQLSKFSPLAISWLKWTQQKDHDVAPPENPSVKSISYLSKVGHMGHAPGSLASLEQQTLLNRKQFRRLGWHMWFTPKVKPPSGQWEIDNMSM